MSEEIGLSIKDILPLLMIQSIFGKTKVSIDQLMDAMIEDALVGKLVDKFLEQVPEEYKDIVDVIKTAMELDRVKALLAAIRGERYTPSFDFSKAIELVLTLQIVSKLESALSGATSGTASSS